MRYNCGGFGHIAVNCRAKGKGKGKGGYNGKGSYKGGNRITCSQHHEGRISYGGKGSTGKFKGKIIWSTGTDVPVAERDCYSRGEKGHLAANCPKKKARAKATNPKVTKEGLLPRAPR